MPRKPVVEMDGSGRLTVLQREDRLIYMEGVCVLLALREVQHPLPDYLRGTLQDFVLAVTFTLDGIWLQLRKWCFEYDEAEWTSILAASPNEAEELRRLVAAYGTASWPQFGRELLRIEGRLWDRIDWPEVIGDLPAAQFLRLSFLWRFLSSVIWWSVDLPSPTLRDALAEYLSAPRRLTPTRWDYVLEVYYAVDANHGSVLDRAVYREADWYEWAPIVINRV